MRSAERGPTPGIWRNCAISSRKRGRIFGSFQSRTSGSATGAGSATDLLTERLEPPQIPFERLVGRAVFGPRAVEFRKRFIPTPLAKVNDRGPEPVTPRDLFRARLFRKREEFINFESIVRFGTAQEIDRARDNLLPGGAESARAEQNL